MVAERAFESSYAYDGTPAPSGMRYIIPKEERQNVEKISRSVRVSRFFSARYDLYVPDYQSTTTPDLVVNGLGAASRPPYVAFAEANSQLGKPTIIVGGDRGLGLFDVLSPRDLLQADRFQIESYEAVLDDITTHDGINVVREKGHSKGGGDAVGIAERTPERVDGVTLIGAAGLSRLNLLRAPGRLSDFYNNELKPNLGILHEDMANPEALFELFWGLAGNIPRTAAEAVNAIHRDLRVRAPALGAHGIKVSILNTAADELVRKGTVEQRLGPLVDLHRIHPNLEIGHLGPQIHAFEMAWELHAMDQELHPGEVSAPREFSVVAMSRNVRARRRAHLPRVHVPHLRGLSHSEAA